MTRSADELYRRVGERDPAWVAQARLIRHHPTLLSQQVATYAAIERELAAEIAGRLPAEREPAMRAKLMAAAFLASLRVATNVWLDQPPDAPLSHLVDRALAETGARFD